MTELSRQILASWQTRKTKKQKTAFIEFLQARLPELQLESFKGLAAGRNLVLGDVSSAKVVFTAHYDTCALLPFPNFITPKNFLIYLLYQILICLPLFVVYPLVLALTKNGEIAYFAEIAMLILFFVLLLGGPASKHTANDNTSGVLTLLELYQKLTPEERAKTALVFFDQEESGLFGSSAFYRKHKKVMRDKLVINFDCVSDGDHFLFVAKKKAQKHYSALLAQAYAAPSGKTCWFETNRTAFYPSDSANFPLGVGVAAMQKKKGIGLYMNKIHTKKDTVMQEENIEFFANGGRRLLALIPQPEYV